MKANLDYIHIRLLTFMRSQLLELEGICARAHDQIGALRAAEARDKVNRLIDHLTKGD